MEDVDGSLLGFRGVIGIGVGVAVDLHQDIILWGLC